MEGRKHKHYHDEEFDHHLLIDTYAGRDKTDTKEELVKITMQKIFQFLSSGIVKGETLIDLTLGAAFCHLMVLADFFKEITILDSSDKALEETKKWLNKDPGAVDWNSFSCWESKAAVLLELKASGTLGRVRQRCTVKGETLIDLTVAPAFSHLMVAADFFKEIFILDSSDSTLNETEKWLNKEPGAVDWSHAAHISCGLKGIRWRSEQCRGKKQDSELLDAEEEKVRRTVKHFLKWDPTNDNPLGSVVLPQADCAISAWYFEASCKDHESYRNSFRKFSSLVKVGGHLILFALFNGTYYTIGDHRFSMLNYNEDVVKEVLQENGYTTVISEVYESKLNTHLVDYGKIGYIVARKEREI
ncbi:nicotinamide N-methyltransferase-like [Pelobates cultripes]|uniref:Nicotinamide N-methyltransferase-like n=1 Tax=Pelobates cultripes TaxID=61616 RepID=A0AAD1T7G5_PELCU|nr:nicotinamide N-methyltransferase-like [Pelobates cultripes]